MTSELGWMFSTMQRIVGPAADGGDVARVRAAFDRFLDNLGRAADLVERDGMPAGPIDRADGFRNVLITLRFAMERVLGEADPHAPAFGPPWPVHLFDWGGASPDAVYHSCSLAGGVTYRISGHLGNSPAASFQFFDGQDICLTVGPEDVGARESGDFEFFVGGAERDGSWFGLPEGVTALLTREFFADWGAAVPSGLEIECLDGPKRPWPPMSPDRVAGELEAIGDWVHLTAKYWANRLTDGYLARPNDFDDFVIRPGLPALSWGHFNVGPGDAWIMEMPAPSSPYWSVQPGTIWWRTLDHANRHSSLNSAQAAPDDDGLVRVVFSHEDPGVANWIDLQGIRNGAAVVRVADPPDDLVGPTARMVPVTDVHRELPGAVRLSPAERQARIEVRRGQITRLLSGGTTAH